MTKILVKIIDSSLRWFLVKNNNLNSRQNGFRRHGSTTNSHFMALSTEFHKKNGNLNQQNPNRTHVANILNLIYQYLMKKEDPPIYASCGTPLSIKHIVDECLSFETDKREAGVSNILSEVLHSDNIGHMITFIIKTNFINSL